MERARAALRWAKDIFGPIAVDRRERALRFLEEAIELAHCEGIPKDIAHAILRRVYLRPAGELHKEIGQSMFCLEMLAENLNVSAEHEATREFARVQSIPRDEWQRRHNAKVSIGIASK